MRYQEAYEVRCTYVTGATTTREFEDGKEAEEFYAREARLMAPGMNVTLVRVAEVTISSAAKAAPVGRMTDEELARVARAAVDEAGGNVERMKELWAERIPAEDMERAYGALTSGRPIND
ncbi:hypothetical protein [Streptomyces hydrogenans]|uniref:hypothetical protein n=1 Tax=Streptomyces hydrogenans TaxID=1873719 RepID=UPI0035E0F54C